MKLKDLITDALFRLYYPYVIRKEKFVAARMWNQGVRQCEKFKKEVGTPRVYLLFDRKHMVWAPMTYEPNRRLMPAFKVLRRMGKMHGMHKIRNVDDMKKVCYYYTPSKWGASGCREDNLIRSEKLGQWLTYYLNRLSEPMRKCRQYQTRRGLLQPE